MLGHVERVGGGIVEGWALDGPAPVRLEILMDGAPPLQVLANRYRADLDHAGLNDGRCGFRVSLPDGAENVRVRRRDDGSAMRRAA